MKDYSYRSDMGKLIKCYIEEKEMTGFKFEKPARWLKRFDEYYHKKGYRGIKITRKMAEEFIYENGKEKKSTHYLKEKILNNLAEFLKRQGYRVYVPPVKTKVKRSNFVPYIFSKDELRRFFVAIEKLPPYFQTNRDIVDPVLFRLLYGCGLRLSEAINLKLKDIDFNSGTVTILGAKNNKDRLVPLAGSLVSRFRNLNDELHTYSSDSSYFFISPLGGRLDKSTVYRRYRDYLLMAGISHTKQGPRLHDLRHSYAVHCFKKWVMGGSDLTNLMPYLAAYMGHSDFRGTQYYLRLTADLYPDIIKKTEAELGYLIPEACHEKD